MNPLIFRKGICDPHIHIFEGKAYLYATHDAPGYEDEFHMEDWQIWSSEDLVEWKLESIILPEKFYCGSLDQCWAVDAAYKNGKYYLYFSTGDWGVGVAVSNRPGGDFQDAIGKALVDYRTEPQGIQKWDPCVFIDDDGSAYLIVGECRLPKPWDCYLIARLNEDMISLAEPFRKIEYIGNPCPEDKPSVHKYKDRYYLTHSSYYAISDSVYGPYVHMGNTDCNIDHGSFFSYQNQTYFASGGMDNPNRFLRASFLAPCHYRADGNIVVDQKIMEYGCGQYDAVWDKIEAEWYFTASSECKVELSDGGFGVRLKAGEHLFFPNIANIEKNTAMQFYGRGRNEGTTGLIEIRENSENGTLLGHCEIQGTEGEMKSFCCELTCGWGTKSIYLCAKDEIELDWFSFDNGKNRSTLEPVYAYTGRGSTKIPDKYASYRYLIGNMELKGAALEGFLDGGAGGRGELIIPYYCKDEEVKLGIFINDHLQTSALFTKAEREFLGENPPEVHVLVEVRPGINKVKLVSEKYQNGRLYIDHVTLKTEKSPCKVYPTANGILNPSGNGCWDGLPQRECDPHAYSGRVVKYLGKKGYSIRINNVDGGEGGEYVLQIRYSRGEPEHSGYELKINEENKREILFPCTGSYSLKNAQIIQVPIVLRKGSENYLELCKIKKNDGGIFIDAISVIPEE